MIDKGCIRDPKAIAEFQELSKLGSILRMYEKGKGTLLKTWPLMVVREGTSTLWYCDGRLEWENDLSHKIWDLCFRVHSSALPGGVYNLPASIWKDTPPCLPGATVFVRFDNDLVCECHPNGP